MNKELLDKLQFQAAAQVNPLLKDREWQRVYIQKYTELIVLECVNAVMDGTKEGDHYAMRIENHFDNGNDGVLHFGVEE